MSAELAAAVAEAEARYVAANPASNGLHVERQRSMPGGNTRTVIHVAPFPLTIAKASGATITDVDDHVYTDFLGEYTAGLYGHSHPIILGAVREALADGICFGAPNEYEAGLAAAVCGRFPSIDLVRFTNSGTEANMLAISLARVHTGREAILVFEGGYHGGVFFYATAAGSPINAPYPTIMGQYNDAEGAARLIAENADRLAAVIVEPLQGSAGCIPAEQGFLETLRAATTEHGVVLIFDEVMTSRLSPGGLQLTHGRDAGPDVARQVRRRRHDVRRLRRPGRADGAVRPQPRRRAPPRRHVQQQRADDGGRAGRADADLHARTRPSS